MEIALSSPAGYGDTSMHDNASFALAIGSCLLPLFGVFWIGMAIFFLRKDQYDRFSLLVLAEEIPSKSIWSRLHVIGSHAGVIVNFLMLASLTMVSSVPWSINHIEAVAEIFHLNFSRFGNTDIVIDTFWASLGVFAICIVGFLLARLPNYSKYLQSRLPFLDDCCYPSTLDLMKEWPGSFVFRSMLLDIMLIPFLARFMQSFNCSLTTHIVSVTSTSPLVEVPSQLCWHGTHLVMGPLGVIAVMGVYVSALILASNSHYHVFNHQLVALSKFRVVFVVVQAPLVFFSLMRRHAALNMGCTALLLALLTILHFRLQPVKGNGRALNHTRTASLAAATWAALSALVCTIINNKENHLPFLLLCVGTPVVGVAAWVGNWQYTKRHERQVIEKVRGLFSNAAGRPMTIMGGKLESYLEATEDFMALSLVDQHKSEMSQMVLDSLIHVIEDAKQLHGTSAELVLANVVQTMGNLLANEACRSVLCGEEAIPVIVTLVMDQDSLSPTTRKVALAALHNISAGAKVSYCVDVVNTNCVDDLIDIAHYSADQLMQWLAVTALCHIARSPSEAVISMLSQKPTLDQLITLTACSNLEVQIRAAELLSVLAQRCAPQDMAMACDERFLPSMVKSKSRDVQRAGRRALDAIRNTSGEDHVNRKIGVDSGPDGSSEMRFPLVGSSGGNINAHTNAPKKSGRMIERDKRKMRAQRSKIPASLDPSDQAFLSQGGEDDDDDFGTNIKSNLTNPNQPSLPTINDETVEYDDDGAPIQNAATKRSKSKSRTASIGTNEGGGSSISSSVAVVGSEDDQKAISKLKFHLQEKEQEILTRNERIRQLEKQVKKLAKQVKDEQDRKMLIAEAKRQLAELQPVLGMQVTPVQSMFGKTGVQVVQIATGKAAQLAGLREGDIIIAIGATPGSSVQNTNHFKQCMTTDYRPGDLIPLHVKRAMQDVYLHMELGAQNMSVEQVRELRGLAGKPAE